MKIYQILCPGLGNQYVTAKRHCKDSKKSDSKRRLVFPGFLLSCLVQPQTLGNAKEENPENQQPEMPDRQPQEDDGRKTVSVHRREKEDGQGLPFTLQPTHIPKNNPHEHEEPDRREGDEREPLIRHGIEPEGDAAARPDKRYPRQSDQDAREQVLPPRTVVAPLPVLQGQPRHRRRLEHIPEEVDGISCAK